LTAIRNLEGQRFGRLLVIQKVTRPQRIKGQGVYWLCKCDCGNEKVVWSSSLISNITKSCGCLRKEHWERRKIGYSQSSINRIYRQYKRHAKSRNLKFELTRERFIELTSGSCFYCGDLPNQVCRNENNTGDYVYNGIDRINNNIGYEIDNCVSCCKQCNRAKSDYTLEEFYNWINKILLIKERIKNVN
jgi:5-methylcytosine-specific restriction endonuclease McrA